MMTGKNKLLMTGLCAIALTLTACSKAEENQQRLARGCEAAVKIMLAKDKYDRQIDKVTAKTFGMSEGYKLVTLDAVTKNKAYGYENDETFYCKFEESSSMRGYIWSASLVQMKIDDDTYGADGGQIYGDMNDQLYLMDAVQAAMK